MVKVEHDTQFLYSDTELAQLIKEREKSLGKSLEIKEDTDKNGTPGQSVDVVEFFEAQEIEKIMARLDKIGLSIVEDYDATPDEQAAEKKRPQKNAKKASVAGPLFKFNADNETIPLFSLKELLQQIKERAKKGMSVQRYKGLGEMNPGQLWETTMDPAKRTLLKVVLEDAVKADEMFTVLMGDAVEPRREFIQKHAREVTNLDV